MDRCSCPELWQIWDLTYLQVNKYACHWVIGTSRRHEIPGSEVKDSLLLTATAAPRVLPFLSQVPRFQFPHGDATRVKRYTYTHSGLQYRIGIWIFYTVVPQYQWGIGSWTPANTEICRCSSPLQSALHIFPFHICIYEGLAVPGSKHAPSLLWRDTPSPSSKDLCQTNILEKIPWNICKWCRNMQDPETCKIHPSIQNRPPADIHSKCRMNPLKSHLSLPLSFLTSSTGSQWLP